MTGCRPTRAEVDASAIEHNVRFIASAVAPAAVCAVVKADGYGHGAVTVARAALAAGAECLAVALVEEAHELRAAGVSAPVLLLSEPPPPAMRLARELDVMPTLYSEAGIEAAAAAARSGDRWPVHLKVDTGMHRVGASPEDVAERARLIARAGSLALDGFCTHLADSDAIKDSFVNTQLARFEAARAELALAGIVPRRCHVANSGGALLHPASRYDMVRVGISLYGCPPAPEHTDIAARLRPVLRLVSQVRYVQTVGAGESVSYGRRWFASSDTRVATVPIGYADGVRRRLGLSGGEVLVRGRRAPIVGVVTMDQLMIAVPGDVDVGDEVVLIGRQGGAHISADEIAERLGTISYEVLCDIGARVPRVAI